MESSLSITIEQRQGVSYMKNTYVTPPFRIVPVGQYKRDNAAYLMIMSTSPGLLDGDDHQLEFNLAQGTKLQLQTQSYQRLFQMRDKSTQTSLYKLGEGAAFSYVPHPVVPQQQSTFISKNVVHLSDNCHFLLSDIVTCGRKMSGEEFAYDHFQNLTQIYHNDRLIIKDNVLLQPQKMPIQGIGILEGYTHQGTLIYFNTHKIDIKQYIAFFATAYSDDSAIAFGISQVQGDGFIVRVLGNGGEKLLKVFREIQEKIWNEFCLK